jgi:hypothetical protein
MGYDEGDGDVRPLLFWSASEAEDDESNDNESDSEPEPSSIYRAGSIHIKVFMIERNDDKP